MTRPWCPKCSGLFCDTSECPILRLDAACAKVELLRIAALAWWKSHRPVDWDEQEHIANPEINTITRVEQALARECARLRSEEVKP